LPEDRGRSQPDLCAPARAKRDSLNWQIDRQMDMAKVFSAKVLANSRTPYRKALDWAYIRRGHETVAGRRDQQGNLVSAQGQAGEGSLISSKSQRNRSRPHRRPQTGIADAGPRLAAGDAGAVKSCSSCGEHKRATAFLPSKFTADHLTDRCRTCTYGQAERDRREREARRLEAEAKKAARTPAPAGVVTKKCKGCSVAKPLAEYARHGSSRDGHRHTCKPCVAAAARAKRLATPPKLKSKRRSES